LKSAEPDQHSESLQKKIVFGMGALEGKNTGVPRTLTRATFLEKAQLVEVVVNGIPMTA